MLNISLILILVLSGIFIGFVLRTNHIIEEQVFSTARAHFRNIVLTRRWNADHGGVYVEKKKGVTSNPYLDNPDILTREGKVFTQKNPALMTREISEYANQAGDFIYHITSLKPLNPDNAPDDFETRALKRFETGTPETSESKKKNGEIIFRYMQPLIVEKACLECHAKQGYRTGDVRGGISVSFDISILKKKMRKNTILIGIISLLTVSLLIVIIFLMVSRLSRNLSSAYDTISMMAITDELTGLYNRRHFHKSLEDEINRSKRYHHPISLLILDIDHFKKVNDTYVHQVGDEVLVGVAQFAKSVLRHVDVIARYGGEEITVILPETDIHGAIDCAEKIRKIIDEKEFNPGSQTSIRVTVSIGASSVNTIEHPSKEVAKNLIKQADDALYDAKAAGRNQVAVNP